MRSNHWLLVLGFGLMVSMGVITMDAAKEKSDKERITQLEQSLEALQKDLAGEHAWANEVNDEMGVLDQRTLDLHKRLTAVELRGPVARVQ